MTEIICQTLVAGEDSSVHWAAKILCERWRCLFGPVKLVHRAGPAFSISIGEKKSAPAIDLDDLSDDGYILTRSGPSPRDLTILARDARGLVYSVFGLLKEIGCGFYLSGEAIPCEPWRNGFPSQWRKRIDPRTHVRGLLPFHNFANGPTCWTLSDYEKYFDTIAAQGLNLAMFHAFDYEPHGAFRFKGKWLPSSVRRNHVRLQGKESVDLHQFPSWARRSFNGRYFGPPDVTETRSLEECIERSQSVMKLALAHARRRHVKSGIGFELHGDPRSTEIRERFLSRIDHFLATYDPDYLVLWQNESAAQTGWNLPTADSNWEQDIRRHAKSLAPLGAPRRGLEVLRLAEFVNVAQQHLSRRRARARIVLSGWGGDKWMSLSDAFPVLDKLVEDDVIFSALDNLDANLAPGVAEAYAQVRPTRERWPIIWLEADAMLHSSLWHPAANVRTIAPLVTDAVAKGSQGVLGIHWRFSDEVEWEVNHFSHCCWQHQSGSAFFSDYAKRRYGSRAGKAVAKHLAAVDKLGPGWTGLSPQTECVPFKWESEPEIGDFAGDERIWDQFRKAAWTLRPQIIRHARSSYAPLARLDSILFLAEWQSTFGAGSTHKRRRLLGVRKSLCTALARTPAHQWPTNGKQNLNDLVVWIDFILGYDRVARLMKPGGEVASLIDEAERHMALDSHAHAAKIARRGLKLMTSASFDLVVKTYAKRVRGTSQRGSLARMLNEAWRSWDHARQRLNDLARGPHGVSAKPRRPT